MGLVGMVLGAVQPGEAAALVKLRVAAVQVRKQVPAEEHWAFAYSMLQRVSRSFAFVIQQLGPELRNAVRAHPHPLPPLFSVSRGCCPLSSDASRGSRVRAGLRVLPGAPGARHGW